MNKLTTEQLVRKCFAYKVGYKAYAAAARRFCRLEQAEKLKRIDKQLWKSPKLPAHWGEIKINGKWVKF